MNNSNVVNNKKDSTCVVCVMRRISILNLVREYSCRLSENSLACTALLALRKDMVILLSYNLNVFFNFK